MLISALWIHLTGGRIETHFSVFGSLVILAFYRDWPVLLTATTVVALDHFLRGLFWPQSVYGVLAGAEWRWLEHAAWVVFQDTFLIRFCLEGVREMREMAEREAALHAMVRAHEENVHKSCRNLAKLSTTLAHQVNTYGLLDCETVVFTQSGLKRLTEVFAR